MFCQETLNSALLGKSIAQVNHTMTIKRGTVRGLHFQYPPYAETKIVSCIRGEVYDVAVDLRQGSPTFLHWHAQSLTAADHKSLLIPEGFAHGFQALSEECELLYFLTAAYHPEAEGGLNSLDPKLGIYWPEPVRELSSRDAGHPMLVDSFEGIAI
jgi:dTDP-4-dehydrorhamnose 3,5-epimerase